MSLLFAIAACGGGAKQTAPTTPPPETTAAGDMSCPLEVPGTSLTVEDTATGAALIFVTTGDVAAVRSRATAFAAMHTQRNGGASQLGMMFPQDWTASASETDNGARIEFTSSDPAKVQQELRMHAGHLSSGSCAM